MIMIMRTCFVLMMACVIIQCQYFDTSEFQNLGSRIAAEVAESTAPLHNLGEQISAQVNGQLKRDLAPVKQRLSELDGLGDRISNEVYQGLEPVRAIPLNFKMRDGVGGTTIITHYPSGRQFVVLDKQIYSCSGSLNLQSGQCQGSLTPYTLASSSPMADWCFLRSYSQVNDKLCLSTGGLSVSVINNVINCKSSNDAPVLLTSLSEYQAACKSVSASAEYRYIPDTNSPDHVAIPNDNKYVKCDNRDRNLCIFNEANDLLSRNSFSGGNYFVHTGYY